MTIAEKLIQIADNTPLVAEAVKAKKGKNLFNERSPQYSGAYCSSKYDQSSRNLVVITKNTNSYISANFVIENGEKLIGKKVTIRGQWQSSGNNNGAIRLIWTDKENKHIARSQLGGTEVSGQPATVTVTGKPPTAGELCLFLYGNYTGTGFSGGSTVAYRNVQVEIGESATPYEPYKDPLLYEEALAKANEIKTALLNIKEESS